MNVKIDSQYLMREVFGLWGNEIDCPVIAEGVVEKALETLPEREVAAVKCRFAERLTYEKMGERLGVTKERAKQILRNAMRKLRHPLKLGRFAWQIDSDDITCLALSVRVENALRRAGINAISGPELASDSDLRKLRNVGTKSLQEIHARVIAFRKDCSDR
jgi:DNA-directed RNA polymerase alpha subunit